MRGLTPPARPTEPPARPRRRSGVRRHVRGSVRALGGSGASASAGAGGGGAAARPTGRAAPRWAPADLGAVELGAGRPRRPRPPPRPPAARPRRGAASGCDLVLGEQAERGQHRGQQHRRQRAVAVGRGVELVGAEEQRRRGRELRARGSSPATPCGRPPRRPRWSGRRPAGATTTAATCLSGGAIGLIGAEVGAGADHDLDAGLAQPAYALGEVAHGLRTAARCG